MILQVVTNIARQMVTVMVCQTLDQALEGDNDQMYLGGEYNSCRSN
jgi:hypothetical protein